MKSQVKKVLLQIVQADVDVFVNASVILKWRTDPQHTWILFGKALTWSVAAVNDSPKRMGKEHDHWPSVHPVVWVRKGAEGCRFTRSTSQPAMELVPENCSRSANTEMSRAIPRTVLLLSVWFLYWVTHHSSCCSTLHGWREHAFCATVGDKSLWWVAFCALDAFSVLFSPSTVCPRSAPCGQLGGRRWSCINTLGLMCDLQWFENGKRKKKRA